MPYSRWIKTLCVLAVLVGASGVHATDYVFPGALPAGCSGAGPSYTCTTLSLGYNDTITVNAPRPATITINGNLSTHTSKINAAGVATDLSITVSGTLTLGYSAEINANVTAGTVDGSAGTEVKFGGNVTATSGNVTLKDKTTVAGSLSSNAGTISIGNNSVISGDIASTTGAVTLLYQARVNGNLSTAGSVDLQNDTRVGGSVVGGTGSISVGYGAAVAGGVSSTSGAIGLAQASSVAACVKSTSSAAITLGYQANANSVCCGSSCGNACVVNNSTYAMPPACTPSQTCVTDNFSTGALNTNLWNPVTVGGSFLPQVVDVGGQKRLRLTTAGTNQATLVQLKKWLPGAANKVVVDFDHYTYGGNGADGVGVVFSDASVAPAPGGNGGSLGYAPKSGVNGFAGGWLGIGIDEFGNYPNSSEGRVGYPAGWVPPAGAAVAAGAYANSVAVRGSGAGTTGYRLLANSGVLSPAIWRNTNTSSTLQKYRITIDHSNSINAYVTVQRDASGTGNNYVTIIPTFDIRGPNSLQAPVPANFLVSLVGGTGGSTNIHELANISTCATYINEPGGSTDPGAFECLETGTNGTWSAAARKPLYTKRASTNFTLDIAALKADGTLEANYVAAGANSKYVRVELFNDAVSPAPTCAAYASPVASQTVTFSSGNFSGSAGRALSGNFNLAATYAKLRCRVKECTDSTCTSFTSVAPACSSDQFSVRPSAATLVTSANAAAPSITATPAFAAGANFTLRATTAPTTYAGTLTLGAGVLTAQNTSQAATQQAGGAAGSLSATALVANAPAILATYSEVGYAYLAPGAYRDDTLTAVDAATGDCITDATNGNNLADTLVGGKYGCSIGNKLAVSLGRFYPDHFTLSVPSVKAFCAISTPSVPFTYFGQDGFSTGFTMTAQNAGGATTQNYRGVFAKFDTSNYAGYGFSAAVLPAGSALQSSATAPAGTFTDGVALISARHQISRPTNPTVETLVLVKAAPTDGEVAAGTPTAVGIDVRLRYGRLRLQNAYGSELLPLPIPLEAQYWDGINYVINTLDSCTVLPMSSIVMSNFTSALAACDTQITPTTAQTLVAGRLAAPGLVLTRPGAGKTGSVDLAINVGLTAAGATCLSPTASAATAAKLPWFAPNTTSKATFGIYRSPLIYRRENY